ncbi:MAG: hypothetical protein NTX45_12395 [Proteobacteria bacterium]|nr:hypothetical protein [Pseudomonadota bacterium]
MNRFFSVFLVAGALFASTAYCASYTQDFGRISNLYTNPDGAIAVHLDTGYPNAIAAGQCSTSSGYWAGLAASNSSLKAALFLAKATGSKVAITIQGCEVGGSWLKILDVYIN